MIELSLTNKFEFIFGLFLWWLAIYLFTQNPFNRIIQIISLLIASISYYFSGLIFLSLGKNEPEIYATIVRTFIWSMYLPMPLLYHASLYIQTKKIKFWQQAILYFGYAAAILLLILELKTNLLRDYSYFTTSQFSGNLNEATGKLFWLSGMFFTPILIGIAINFLILSKGYKRFTSDWIKFILPVIGSVIAICLGPLTVLSYYGVVLSSNVLSILTFSVVILPIIYSILKYNLFFDDLKIIFGKSFFYNTLIISILIIFFGLIASGFNLSAKSTISFAIVYALLHATVLTHPVYNWLITFSRDILYNKSSGFSVVNDEEVGRAIKDYQQPERLEENSLLRLRIVTEKVKKKKLTPVDALREIIKESIDYYKPTEINRRTKQNLKYQILKMVTFDEAEEGQILWELGFDEYPVRVMQQERKSRPPLLTATAPSDYSYTSRNAYLALKKETIHNITWRISYLEKLARKII